MLSCSCSCTVGLTLMTWCRQEQNTYVCWKGEECVNERNFCRSYSRTAELISIWSHRQVRRRGGQKSTNTQKRIAGTWTRRHATERTVLSKRGCKTTTSSLVWFCHSGMSKNWHCFCVSVTPVPSYGYFAWHSVSFYGYFARNLIAPHGYCAWHSVPPYGYFAWHRLLRSPSDKYPTLGYSRSILSKYSWIHRCYSAWTVPVLPCLLLHRIVLDFSGVST